MIIEYTKKEIEALRSLTLERKDCKMFLHCKTCIPIDVPKGQSAEQYGAYELATCAAVIGERRINFLTIWCKHCQKLVWDSRHLKHAY